jgi:preprotein translocase subunit YajC
MNHTIATLSSLPTLPTFLAEGASDILGNPMIMMVLMFVIFWVVLIRPQQKQRKALAARQAGLKKGDKVVTIGGMHASVNAVSEKTISLKLSEGVFVKYDKTAIATVLTKGDKNEDADNTSKG